MLFENSITRYSISREYAYSRTQTLGIRYLKSILFENSRDFLNDLFEMSTNMLNELFDNIDLSNHRITHKINLHHLRDFIRNIHENILKSHRVTFSKFHWNFKLLILWKLKIYSITELFIKHNPVSSYSKNVYAFEKIKAYCCYRLVDIIA